VFWTASLPSTGSFFEKKLKLYFHIPILRKGEAILTRGPPVKYDIPDALSA